MKYHLFILFCLVLFFLHCPGYSSSKKGQDFTLKELISAADTLMIDGIKMVIDSYLWRDFMPFSPPDGKPLRAAISLVPTNADFLPQSIDARKIWIIFQEEIWASSLSAVGSDEITEPRRRLDKMAANGPKWGPGGEVTVVIEVVDQKGKSHLLKRDHQPIHRTD